MPTFSLKPSSPVPLALLRIAVASALLIQAYLLSDALFEFYGRHGILQASLTDLFTADRFMPRAYQLCDALAASFGWRERQSLIFCGSIYLASLVCLLLGVASRWAALVACVLHAIFLTTGFYSAYGVDRFTQVCLFYFIFMPVSDAYALTRPRQADSEAAKLSLRVMQAHLCIIYAASGLEKMVGIQWQNGEAVFRAMMLPAFQQFDMTWLAYHPWLATAFCWGTLTLEILYPLMIWPRATRRYWIAGIASMHLGIALLMGLYLFGTVMTLLTLCSFGAEEYVETRRPVFDQDPQSSVAATGSLSLAKNGINTFTT